MKYIYNRIVRTVAKNDLVIGKWLMYPFVFLKAKKAKLYALKAKKKRSAIKKKLEYRRSWHTRTTVEVSKID